MGLIYKDHIYSYSQLSQFDECPYSFYMQRIEKQPQAQNAFSQQGSLIHDLIDKWSKKELAKEELPLEYMARYENEVTEKWPRFLASKGYAEKTYQQGLDYFLSFDEFAGYEILGTEEKFETDLCGRRFVGIIDMIIKDEVTDELIVLDHKSKSLASFKSAQNEMYRQQLIYSKYVKEKYGSYPDRLMFNLFKENGLKMERPFNQEAFEDAMTWANDVMNKIESFEVVDWLTNKASDFFCQELCSVRNQCANGRPLERIAKKET